jgi:hypothetical protein
VLSLLERGDTPDLERSKGSDYDRQALSERPHEAFRQRAAKAVAAADEDDRKVLRTGRCQGSQGSPANSDRRDETQTARAFRRGPL